MVVPRRGEEPRLFAFIRPFQQPVKKNILLINPNCFTITILKLRETMGIQQLFINFYIEYIIDFYTI